VYSDSVLVDFGFHKDLIFLDLGFAFALLVDGVPTEAVKAFFGQPSSP